MIFYKILSILIYIMFIPVFFLSSLLLISVSFLYFPLFFKIDKICCRFMLSSLLVWPRLKGTFPRDGTYIIMMNHSSFIDVFIFPLIPRGIYTGVTAVENFKMPIFSSLIRRIKAIPIERENIGAAIESIKKAEMVLNQGIHVGILPEGTRTLNGRVGSLKKGGFHMAINTHTPIVPVGVIGAFNFKPKNRWWIKPVPITINIGSTINPETYKALGLDGLKNIVEQKLIILSGELYENK